MDPIKWKLKLHEAFTTTDFPYLFGQVMDRQLMSAYTINVADWKQFVQVRNVADLRKVEMHKVQGQDQVLDRVTERGNYPEARSTDAYYELQVFKRGRIFDIDLESVINDVLGAFRDIPSRFANAVIRTENKIITGLYASASGPNTNLYGATITDVDGSTVTNLGTRKLTVKSLQNTLAAMRQQTDASGEPILARGAVLVVPPALEWTARQILESGTLIMTGTSNIIMGSTNIVANAGLTLVVDPYLPIVDISANKDTTWYVFCKPAEGAALTAGYLNGYESPEIAMKSSNKILVNGGTADVMSGDFESDSIRMRVRHFFGGVACDPRYTYANDGTGDNS
jgi:hypothetical protein